MLQAKERVAGEKLMDEVSKSLKKHYEETFRQFGPTSKGVGWGENEERQYLRYEKMLAVIERGLNEAPTLLDVGCGYGGLFDYANKNGIPINYTGIDVGENMVSWARETFPKAMWIVGDILEAKIARSFDYVVCNGILTQKLDVPGLVMDEFANRLIHRIFDMCDKGIAFNVMTTKVNFFSNNLYYRNPAELFSWCISEISPLIRLDHAYPFFEYTVYLYR
jgi:SAM-dependent methyltransferase